MQANPNIGECSKRWISSLHINSGAAWRRANAGQVTLATCALLATLQFRGPHSDKLKKLFAMLGQDNDGEFDNAAKA